MPTARELTRKEWQPYIDGARSRLIPRWRPSDPKREEIVARVHNAAALLKDRFGVHKVYLFGSLTEPNWFAPDSDVDLAVEGLAPGVFWEAWELVEDVIRDRPVDLIDLETAKPSLARAVKQHGLEL